MAETPTTATEINTTSLLTAQGTHDSLYEGGARTLTALSIFLGLFAGRRGAAMVMRESAVRQLEDWRENWGYSLPAVVIDTTWNLGFVVVSIVMLFWTAREQPNVPVRAWICVYALQCLVHVFLLWSDYKWRNRRSATAGSSSSDSDQSSFEDSRASHVMSDAKKWDILNTMIKDLWWMGCVGWLLPNLNMQRAPHLFWLTLTFVGTDFFFSAIGCLKELIIGLAWFRFPFYSDFLHVMGGGMRGASKAAIRALPKYRFIVSNDHEEAVKIRGRMVPFETNRPNFSHEHILQSEDSECCICLCVYENGTKLHLLPCNHHFHVTCIMLWLKRSRNCPLCKYTIV